MQIVKEPFKVADTVLFFKQKQTWRQVVDSLGGAAIYGIARTQVTQTKRDTQAEVEGVSPEIINWRQRGAFLKSVLLKKAVQ